MKTCRQREVKRKRLHCEKSRRSKVKRISWNTQVIIFVIWMAMSATRNMLHCSQIFKINSHSQDTDMRFQHEEEM